jgi:hypothetical protein
MVEQHEALPEHTRLPTRKQHVASPSQGNTEPLEHTRLPTNQSTRGSSIDPSSRGSSHRPELTRLFHRPELTRLTIRAHEALLSSPRDSPRASRGPNSPRATRGPFFPGDHGSPELTRLPTIRLAARAHEAQHGWSSTGLRWSSRDSGSTRDSHRWQHEAGYANQNNRNCDIYMAPESSIPL